MLTIEHTIYVKDRTGAGAVLATIVVHHSAGTSKIDARARIHAIRDTFPAAHYQLEIYEQVRSPLP